MVPRDFLSTLLKGHRYLLLRGLNPIVLKLDVSREIRLPQLIESSYPNFLTKNQNIELLEKGSELFNPVTERVVATSHIQSSG